MQIVSINMIIDLNNIIKENGLEYRIHLRDACGSQSMWIEELNSDADNKSRSKLDTVINDYFAKQKMTLKFSDDYSSFRVM